MLIVTFAEVLEKPFKLTKFIFKSIKLIGYCISYVATVKKTFEKPKIAAKNL